MKRLNEGKKMKKKTRYYFRVFIPGATSQEISYKKYLSLKKTLSKSASLPGFRVFKSTDKPSLAERIDSLMSGTRH